MARMSLPAAWQQLKRDQRASQRTTRRIRAIVAKTNKLPPPESASAAGLRYVCDERTPGIRRIGSKHRARYVDANGRTIGDSATLQRIKSLAIPPAWTDVWICADPRGHLQATGRDARGRKQYRYHPKWREVRDEVKYSRLLTFARALPRIRQQTDADLRKSGLPRAKVLAAVVRLLEKTLIRVGNEEYAKQNGSVGLTTMRDHHAKVKGSKLRFEFRGKSGIQHAIDLADARLARIVKACRDLPGYELFQYIDDSGRRIAIDSADVNAYLREISGEDFTAKDFRTWAGTVLTSQHLSSVRFSSIAEAKRNIIQAVTVVAKQLGNTKAVCRKSYIHPAIFDAYLDGLPLGGDEHAVASVIRRHLRAA
jgi:DNA topoisomerase I